MNIYYLRTKVRRYKITTVVKKNYLRFGTKLLRRYSGFQAAVDTPEILLLLLLLLLPYGRINSRMTSYLKIFVLIDFHFQDAIFPFNRAAPYGMTSAVPREQG